MKKIIVKKKEESEVVDLNLVAESTPIFVKLKKDGRLKGMVLREQNNKWVTKIGGNFGSSNGYNTREECINYESQYYDFYIED